jgi:predicted esterase
MARISPRAFYYCGRKLSPRAILFRVMVPLEPEKPPELANVRVWVGAGNHDPIIPTSETQRLVNLLRTAGADVTVRFLSAGHALTPADISLAHDWLHKL